MSERCATCGCELAYPTAIHLVDCPNPIEKKREEISEREMVIDHAAEARKILEAVEPYTNNDLGVAMNSAHIHATLALVEQQRIANLIAIASSPGHAMATVARGFAYMALIGQDEMIKPDIAVALGIEEGQEG